MVSKPGPQLARKTCIVEFWQGFRTEIDLNDISESAIAVKGKSYHTPLRFLEIYGNFHTVASTNNCPKFVTRTRKQRKSYPGFLTFSGNVDNFSWSTIEKSFMPRISGVNVSIEEKMYQPPFAWKDCDPRTLCVNFTYNTNAIYRILSNLCDQGRIPEDALDKLLDSACTVLSYIYKFRNNFIMKNINNNFNMFLISKVIEFLVGKDIYDSECQELPLTQRSLATSLAMVKDYANFNTIEKMGVALGKGVSFIEKRLSKNVIRSQEMRNIQETSYQYYERNIAIDHRQLLFDMIANEGLKKNSFILAAILDDATETVDDLLWMLDLMEQFPFLKVYLLVNTAQVSINFSSHMLASLLQSPNFANLRACLGTQFLVTEMYCPFISFQTNYLPPSAKSVIDKADVIYIKGANFFETCQLDEKDTFYAFVVYGPISRTYTGLNDYDAVFAYVPAGRTGYIHNPDPSQIVTLSHVVDSSEPQCDSKAALRNR